jgi:hypothetical protein
MRARKVKRLITSIQGFTAVDNDSWKKLQPLISREKRVQAAMTSMNLELDAVAPEYRPCAASNAIYFGIFDTEKGKSLHAGVCGSESPDSDNEWPNTYVDLQWPSNVQPGISRRSPQYWLFDYLIPLAIVSLVAKKWAIARNSRVPVFAGFDEGDVFSIHRPKESV